MSKAKELLTLIEDEAPVVLPQDLLRVVKPLAIQVAKQGWQKPEYRVEYQGDIPYIIPNSNEDIGIEWSGERLDYDHPKLASLLRAGNHVSLQVLSGDDEGIIMAYIEVDTATMKAVLEIE